MGIALSSLVMLLAEHNARPYSGSVLQIGRQDIYFEYEMLQTVAQKMSVSLKVLEELSFRPNEWMPGVKTIDDKTFFASLGFDVVHSADASGYEHADIVHDFNVPISSEYHAHYDLIFDGGSLEHIFHVPNALANFHALLKVGGRIVHHSPTHNFVDHGFYCLQPTLFYDYYETNRYSDLRCHFVGASLPHRHNEVPKVFPYTPGVLEPYSVGGVTKEKFQGCEMFVTTFSATKTSDSTAAITPIQRRYRNWWANAQKNEKA